MKKKGREIVPISYAQKNKFAANAFEVINSQRERCLVINRTAFKSLNQAKIDKIASHLKMVIVEVEWIEKLGNGRIRCTPVGLFIPNTKQSQISNGAVL